LGISQAVDLQKLITYLFLKCTQTSGQWQASVATKLIAATVVVPFPVIANENVVLMTLLPIFTVILLPIFTENEIYFTLYKII